MKVELNGQQIHPRRGAPVCVGNVYANNYGKPYYRLVLSVMKRTDDRPWKNVVCLRIDTKGEIVGCVNEPEAYVRDHQDLVGFAPAVEKMNFKIQWIRGTE